MGASYTVLLPVKPPGSGKTRLGDLPRGELATAFVLDTATACLECPSVAEVLVVTDDAVLATRMTELGCRAIPDGVSGDLNRSLELAAAEALRRRPEVTPVALCADLPCLRAAELETALGQHPGGPRFVADAGGDGTTMYAAPGDWFAPRFGPGSAAAHLAAGALPVTGELPGLRLDVDVRDDLVQAVRLGTGPHTSSFLAGERAGPSWT